jgi:hypothetical protein
MPHDRVRDVESVLRGKPVAAHAAIWHMPRNDVAAADPTPPIDPVPPNLSRSSRP